MGVRSRLHKGPKVTPEEFAKRIRLAFSMAIRAAQEQEQEDEVETLEEALAAWETNRCYRRPPWGQLASAVDCLILAEADGIFLAAIVKLTHTLYPPSLHTPPPPDYALAAGVWSPWQYGRFLALGMALPDNPDAKTNRRAQAILSVSAADLMSSPEVQETESPTDADKIRAVVSRTLEILEPYHEDVPYTFRLIMGIQASNSDSAPETPTVPTEEVDTDWGDWVKKGVVGAAIALAAAGKIQAGIQKLLGDGGVEPDGTSGEEEPGDLE